MNGSKYEGSFVNGERDGKGVLTFSNKDRYFKWPPETSLRELSMRTLFHSCFHPDGTYTDMMEIGSKEKRRDGVPTCGQTDPCIKENTSTVKRKAKAS